MGNVNSNQEENSKKSDKEKIDFGFKKVDASSKAGMVFDVFESVASKYDIMNDLMSGGLHRLWKDKMIYKMRPKEDSRLLDLAGGTGDIAFRFYKKAKQNDLTVHITVTDINEHMLEQGKAKGIDSNIIENVDWNVVNAEEIPYDDNSFDYVSIAFGIRNVTDRNKALKEILRVLKPSGKFVCMEFSHVDNPIMAKIYDGISFGVIPNVGKIVTGDKESYQYLVESIREFPSREEFRIMIEDAGFRNVSYETLSQGVVAIHTGVK